MQLNQFQKEAIYYKDGPCLVTSCPGSGKCVTGDTLILSNQEKISEIKDNSINEVIGLLSENFSNISCGDNVISEFVDSGEHETIKIVSENGYSIEGTFDHPITVVDEFGNFVWKKLKDGVINSL